jgi:hypothetical protein
MNMKNLLAACLFCGIALTLSAQQSVPPPPQPASESHTNNAAVLKFLRGGMSESTLLYVISVAAGTFDTSADALAALKQAGASEAELRAIAPQGATPAKAPPAANAPAAGAQTNSSPTLAETMKFIQDKLNDNNKTSWIDYAKPTRDDGGSWEGHDTVTHEFSSVVADTGQCRISYHIFTKHSVPYRWLATSDGKNNKGEDISFSLRSVQEIVVKPWEQYETEWLAKNGHPDATVISSAPAMTALVVHQPHGVENVFTFDDAAIADRVAKAMVHSVELCGGGQKSPEPF